MTTDNSKAAALASDSRKQTTQWVKQ